MSITNIEVELVGSDGNAFCILGKVKAAMKHAKIDKKIIDEYIKKATVGNYDHLLAVTMEYVDVT